MASWKVASSSSSYSAVLLAMSPIYEIGLKWRPIKSHGWIYKEDRKEKVFRVLRFTENIPLIGVSLINKAIPTRKLITEQSLRIPCSVDNF